MTNNTMKEYNQAQPQLTVSVLGKHFDITVPIRDYVLERAHKLEHLNHFKADMVVRLEVHKLEHRADIVMKFSHFKITVHAVTEELYSAIDKAFDKLKSKIRKWKDRIQDHHARGIPVIDLQVNVLEKHPSDLEEINDEIEEANLKEMDTLLSLPKVYKKKTRKLKTLNLSEAVMKMELSGDHFLIYRSEEDHDLKVLYRRKDGSYGVIDLSKDILGFKV